MRWREGKGILCCPFDKRETWSKEIQVIETSQCTREWWGQTRKRHSNQEWTWGISFHIFTIRLNVFQNVTVNIVTDSLISLTVKCTSTSLLFSLFSRLTGQKSHTLITRRRHHLISSREREKGKKKNLKVCLMWCDVANMMMIKKLISPLLTRHERENGRESASESQSAPFDASSPFSLRIRHVMH